MMNFKVAAHWLCLIAMGLLSSAAAAQEGAPEPQAEAEGVQARMRQAYADIRTYQSDVTFRTVIDDGRRQRVMWSTYRVAFDAQRPGLLIDRPDTLLVADGQNLFLRIEDLDQRYLKMPMPSPLDFNAVFDLLPGLHEPMLPDAVMLLSDDPLLPLAGWWRPDQVEEAPASETKDGRPRLRVSTQQGAMTLVLDPQTYLVVESILDIDPALAQLAPGQTLTQRFEIDIQRRNEPLPSDIFAWNAAPGQPVPSIEALFTEQQPQQQPQPADLQHPLIGRDTPPLVFQTQDGDRFQISDVQAEVVVLDFWATWCMPCRMWMPQLAEIQKWADANGKSVKIISISVDADEPAARQFWKQHRYPLQLALPVDQQALSAAYGPVRRDATGKIVPAGMPLPYTVMIHNNKVVDFHEGVGPQMRGKLQDQIESLLAQ